MKIAFINLKDTVGGAVIAMNRLIDGMLSNRSMSFSYDIIVGRKKTNDSKIHQVRNRFQRVLEERLIDPVTRAIGLQYQWLPFSSRDIRKYIKAIKPDVINLHLTHGAYFQTTLVKELSTIAPIVWTLHDMWSFTGNSAHTFGDNSWKELRNPNHLTKIYPTIGINSGAFLLRQKQAIYNQSDLTIVTPSKWLQQLALQSPVFSKKQVLNINNGLDLSIFKPFSKKLVRNELGISDDAKVIMFSSAYLKGDIWKGGRLLIEILSELSKQINYNILLLLIGSGENEELKTLPNFTVRNTGYISDEKRMAQLLSAADIFLYPTRADTLPNVLVEAIACGTPCLTFDIGGCSEIVKDGYNGVVVSPGDIKGIVNSLIRLIDEKDTLATFSMNARAHAETNYSKEKMASEYWSLFRNLTHSK